MSGVAVEAMLELWASALRDVKARMRPLFTQGRVAVSNASSTDQRRPSTATSASMPVPAGHHVPK